MLSVSGGHPIGLFGEWDGHTLLPMAVSSHGQYTRLVTSAEAR
jgi:hypothetical protein